MGDKLALRFLGLLETTQYTLEQSHGIPPGSVVSAYSKIFLHATAAFQDVLCYGITDNF
jgi:hypothetical protein